MTDEDEIRFVGSDAGNSRGDHFDAHILPAESPC
jgi:hypothetical protein